MLYVYSQGIFWHYNPHQTPLNGDAFNAALNIGDAAGGRRTLYLIGVRAREAGRAAAPPSTPPPKNRKMQVFRLIKALPFSPPSGTERKKKPQKLARCLMRLAVLMDPL